MKRSGSPPPLKWRPKPKAPEVEEKNDSEQGETKDDVVSTVCGTEGEGGSTPETGSSLAPSARSSFVEVSRPSSVLDKKMVMGKSKLGKKRGCCCGCF